MGEKYLITGAAGHLGCAILQELASKNVAVRALVLPNDPFADKIPAWVETVYGDVCDIASLEDFFDNPKQDDLIVIHAAGIVSITSRFDSRLYQVNVNGTKNIVTLCLKNNVSRFIYVSSVHALPDPPLGQMIIEAKSFHPHLIKGAYAKTKAEASQIVMNAISNGLKGSIVHPSGIIGPYDYGRGHMTAMIIDYYTGKLNTCIKGGYDFVDVRDVAKGILSCCNLGKPGEAYILSNRYCSVEEILSTLHKLSGKKEIKHTIPLWLAKAASPCAEFYYRRKNQTPLYPAYSISTLSKKVDFSHKKADLELHYTTTPLEITLQDTLDWLKKNQRL
ncbi:MAG: NAD-dependent epimerase/dehydratase family protein [Clostridiales bacterium]|nr:NAD-dependent epimerase/dehydratase family protein [Clostridiales bacterium]